MSIDTISIQGPAGDRVRGCTRDAWLAGCCRRAWFICGRPSPRKAFCKPFANRHDTKAFVPVLRELADGGFQGPALCDLGYRGKRLAEAGQALGITVEAIARGRDGQFIPAGICWVVERSFSWLSRYRRLNTIFERSKEHLIAFVAIAILSRRLRRLVVEELNA